MTELFALEANTFSFTLFTKDKDGCLTILLGRAGGVVVKLLDYDSKRPGFESRRKRRGFLLGISHLLVGPVSA